jgi:hypothetical protein
MVLEAHYAPPAFRPASPTAMDGPPILIVLRAHSKKVIPMLWLRFTAVFLFCSLIPARANLGDTVQQIVARYGKPTGYAEATAKSPFGSLLFKAGSYELVVFLLDNKEVGARVSKLDNSAISDAEIQDIMANDTGGSKWTSTPGADPSSLQWQRGDKATVLYDKDKHMLIFTADAMAQALHNPAPPAAK